MMSVEGLSKGVQRTGADVAVDDSESTQRQRADTGAVAMPFVAGSFSHWLGPVHSLCSARS